MMKFFERFLPKPAPAMAGKFQVPRITQRMPLEDYAPGWKDAEIYVWINPPTRMVNRWSVLVAQSVQATMAMTQADTTAAEKKRLMKQLETIGAEMNEWLVEIWSQGPKETHITRDELTKTFQKLIDTDPGLPHWMREKTLQMIDDHRRAEKKV